MNSNPLVLSFALVSVIASVQLSGAQEQNTTGPLSRNRAGWPQNQPEHPKKVSEQDLMKKVTKVNKASNFIGMNVKNLQNENLGKVEDLALDLEGAKVPYAVVSVGGFLGLNEKYIAVPLTALTPAPGEQHLVLDASKERLEQAAGFAKNNWPDLDAPAWGPESGYTTAAGSSGQTAQQEGTSSDRSDLQHFSGKVTAVEPSSRTLTINAAGTDKIFVVEPSAKVGLENQPNAKLEDLKVGSRVSLEFLDQNGKARAKSVRLLEDTPSSNSQTK